MYLKSYRVTAQNKAAAAVVRYISDYDDTFYLQMGVLFVCAASFPCRSLPHIIETTGEGPQSTAANVVWWSLPFVVGHTLSRCLRKGRMEGASESRFLYKINKIHAIFFVSTIITQQVEKCVIHTAA